MSTPSGAPPANRLDSLITDHPIPTWRALAWPIMIMLSLLIVFANFAELEEVASSPGEVIPQGKIKLIQHLEGGIIEEIFVSDGDIVRKDQTLMQLDLASGGANLQELEVRLDNEILAHARLEAEANGTNPIFPEDVATRRPTQANAERQSFLARKRQLDAGLNVLKELVTQRQLEVEELISKRESLQANLDVVKKRFDISKSLLDKALVARTEHLQIEQELESLKGEIQSLKSAVPRARATVTEAKQRLTEDEVRFRREAQEEMAKAGQNISRIGELLQKAKEQGVRAEIKSPIDGVVKNLRYNTIGGVIKAGEAIMEIVPTGENLIIEAKLKVTERGYINEGQRALIKISTYDFSRYGGLEGTVTMVAPDSSTDEDGSPYFRVIIKPEKTYLGNTAGQLAILPGMEATVDIHTGQKSVMDYLISPVLKLRDEAFRER